MAIEIINVGAAPNDATGDPLRTAFQKINNNFAFLTQSSWNLAEAVTIDGTPNQIIFEYPANIFTQGMFQVKSYNPDNNDSQDSMLQVHVSNDYSNVKFGAYGTTFFGNNVCTYDMAINSGNVQINITPFANVTLNHFLCYQISWIGSLGLGSSIISEDDKNLITEQGSNVFITTEN